MKKRIYKLFAALLCCGLIVAITACNTPENNSMTSLNKDDVSSIAQSEISDSSSEDKTSTEESSEETEKTAEYFVRKGKEHYKNLLSETIRLISDEENLDFKPSEETATQIAEYVGLKWEESSLVKYSEEDSRTLLQFSRVYNLLYRFDNGEDERYEDIGRSLYFAEALSEEDRETVFALAKEALKEFKETKYTVPIFAQSFTSYTSANYKPEINKKTLPGNAAVVCVFSEEDIFDVILSGNFKTGEWEVIGCGY